MAIYNPHGEQGFNFGNFPGPPGFTGFNSGAGGGIFDGGSPWDGTGAGGGGGPSKLFDTGDSGNPWDANSANFSNPWENASFNFTATNPSSGGNNPWDINSLSFVNPYEDASFNFTAFNPSQGAGINNNPWDVNSPSFVNPWENANFNFTATNPSGPSNPWDVNSSDFVNPYDDASFNFTAINPSSGGGPFTGYSSGFQFPSYGGSNPGPFTGYSEDFQFPSYGGDNAGDFTGYSPDFQFPSYGGDGMPGADQFTFNPKLAFDPDLFFDPTFDPDFTPTFNPDISVNPDLAFDPDFTPTFNPELLVNPEIAFNPDIDLSNIFQGFNPFEGIGDVGGMGGQGGSGGSALGYGGAGGSIDFGDYGMFGQDGIFGGNPLLEQGAVAGGQGGEGGSVNFGDYGIFGKEGAFGGNPLLGQGAVAGGAGGSAEGGSVNFGDYGIFGKEGAFGGNPLLGQGAVAGGSGGAGGLGGEGGAGGAGGLGGEGGYATGGSAEANFIIPEQGLFGGGPLVDFGSNPLSEIMVDPTQTIGDTTIDSSVDLSGFGTEALVDFGDKGIFGGQPLLGPDAINIDMSMPGQQLPDWLQDSGIMRDMIGDVIDQRGGLGLPSGMDEFFTNLSGAMVPTIDPDMLSGLDLDFATGRNDQINEVGGIVAPGDTGYGEGYSLDEFEMDDQPVLDMPEINDYRDYLTNPLVDGVTEALGSANPFDTRMDSMLAGEDNIIDRQYEEALENINHQFGLTDNLGSPAYRKAVADLNRDMADSKIRLRSDFQQQAAATDEALRRNRLGDLSQALTQTTGLFTDEMSRQNQFQQQAIDDYYRNLAASEAAYYRPLNYEDEGMRMAMGGIGQAISPSGSSANQGLMNAANMYSGAANQSRQGSNALANTLMDFGQGAYNWWKGR